MTVKIHDFYAAITLNYMTIFVDANQNWFIKHPSCQLILYNIKWNIQIAYKWIVQ